MDAFTQRYLQDGQTSVANYLLDHFREVGMTTDQLLVYLQLRREMDRGVQWPDADQVASRLGWTVQRVYQVLHELITQKLMTITTVTNGQGQKQDTYDFRLLAEKLSQLPVHEADIVATETATGTTTAKSTAVTEAKAARAAVFNHIEQEFGRPLSPIEMETINDWLEQDHYQPELIQLALKESVLNQVYNLKYLDRILLNWHKKHLTTAAQVQQAKAQQSERTTPPATGRTTDRSTPKLPIIKLTD
ncbi:DNA replication protein DnaD [Lactobacillus sp. PFC-70]|nr:DNA replication protein DnaD [Lactobacillus sp. PFC-70]